MGVKRQYLLQIGLESDADVENMEEHLQQILLDLYDAGGVNSIHVVDQNSVPDETMDEIVSILDKLESRDIRRGIDLVREMEDDDE